MLPDFDEEFASLSDYASMYRSLGLQVVPAVYPGRNALNWKRPALQNWREYQNELVDGATFEKFFHGVNLNKTNIGILTGNCSTRVFVVDLDLHKGGDCAVWWSCCLDMQDSAGELDTPTQITGGGGLQLFFRAPENWNPPTIKTNIGVDIRGIGGFAVIAPSMHESGKRYRWEEGKEPWSIDIADAPQWLCEQIDLLAQEHGGHAPSAGGVKTASPDHMSDGYGHLIDGREDYMAKMIWARVVDLYRDAPFISDEVGNKERDALFITYVSKVDTRLPPSALSKEDALEREGRGRTAFNHKWSAAIRQWDDKVSEHAKEPKRERKVPYQSFEEQIRAEMEKNVLPDEEEEPRPAEEPSAEEPKEEEKKQPEDDFSEVKGLLEILDLKAIMALPDPTWLIDDLFIEDATAFLYGPPGCGKSFIALDMAFALACPSITHWWGRKVNRHGPVIYISSEGTASLKFRLMALEDKYGIPHGEAPFYLIRRNLNFLDPKDIINVIKAVKYEVVNKLGVNPVAIFIDTVSRAIPGADENLQKDMTVFINAIGILKQTFNCMATGVHHQNKDGGTQMRGSTTLAGAGDANIQVERENGVMIGQIHARKIKDSIDGWSEDFELKKVVVGFAGSSLIVDKPVVATNTVGTPVGASAADFGGQQETGFTTIGRKLPDAVWKAIFDEVDQAKQEGIPWSEFKQSGSRYAGTRIMEIIYSHGIDTMNESDADAIVRKLTGKLYLVTVEYIHNKMLKKGLEVRNRPIFNV
jgi:hypothetical protein